MTGVGILPLKIGVNLCLCLYLCGYGPPAHGQPPKASIYERELQGIHQELQKAVTPYLQLPATRRRQVAFAEADRFLQQSLSRSDYRTNAALNSLQITQDSLRRVTGLGFSAGYYENWNNSILEEEGAFFQRRGFLELNYQVLNNGLYERTSRIRAATAQKQTLEALYLNQTAAARQAETRLVLTFFFNKEKIKLLDEWRGMTEIEVSITEKIYYIFSIAPQKLLELRARKAEIDRLLAQYRAWNKGMEQLYSAQLKNAPEVVAWPVVELNYTALLDTFPLEKKRQAMSLIADAPQYAFWNIVTLRPYIRYNFMNNFLPAARDYFSMGFSFSMPLNLSPLSYSAQMRAEESRKAVDDRVLRDRIRLLEIGAEADRLLRACLKSDARQSQLQEALRAEILKNLYEDPSNSPQKVLEQSSSLLEARLEGLAARHQLYLTLVEVYPMTDNLKLGPYIEEAAYSADFTKFRGYRSLYIWSKAFNQTDLDYLVHYLLNNEFRRVFLSFSQNIEPERLRKFCIMARTQGIEVHAMLGDPSYVLAEKRPALLEKIRAALAYSPDGIHLDIEPHTLKDWPETKEKYLEGLLETYRAAANLLAGKNVMLSAALPVFYPEDFLSAIPSAVSEVVLMAYETRSPRIIAKNLAEERQLNKLSINIAIRTDDFKSRKDIEVFLTRVIDETTLQRVVIHDLDGLQQLDKMTLTETIDK